MRSLTALHPEMRRWADAFKAAYPRGQLTSTFRSVGEQKRLWDAYQSGRSRFPAERPGSSTHHTGLAFDFIVPQGPHSEEQKALGRWWGSVGGVWAGERDPIHFQHPEARTVLAAGLTRQAWWL